MGRKVVPTSLPLADDVPKGPCNLPSLPCHMHAARFRSVPAKQPENLRNGPSISLAGGFLKRLVGACFAHAFRGWGSPLWHCMVPSGGTSAALSRGPLTQSLLGSVLFNSNQQPHPPIGYSAGYRANARAIFDPREWPERVPRQAAVFGRPISRKVLSSFTTPCILQSLVTAATNLYRARELRDLHFSFPT